MKRVFVSLMGAVLAVGFLAGCGTSSPTPSGSPAPFPSSEAQVSELYDDSIIAYSANGGSEVEDPAINLEVTKELITGYLYPGNNEETRFVETPTPDDLWLTLKETYPLVRDLGETTTVEESELCDTIGGPSNSLLVISGSDVYVDYQMFFCTTGAGFDTAAEEWLEPVFVYLEETPES